MGKAKCPSDFKGYNMGITDGTMKCALCGEWKTGCNLCLVAPLIKNSSFTSYSDELKHERELDEISRSIRKGAEVRRGERW